MGVFVEGAAGGGVDNSKFATAKAANIEKGYTAEVMGELVTGTLETGAEFISAFLSIMGCSRYKVETVTPTSNSTTLKHSLGTTPKVALIAGNNSKVSSDSNVVKRSWLFLHSFGLNGTVKGAMTNYFYGNNEYGGWDDNPSSMSMGSSAVANGFTFKAGVKYTILTAA